MFQIVPTVKCSFNKGDLSSLLIIQINCKYLVCLCFRELMWGRGWVEEVVFVTFNKTFASKMLTVFGCWRVSNETCSKVLK